MASSKSTTVSRMLRGLNTASGLSWGDWCILAQAWILLLVANLALRALPFWRVRDLPVRGLRHSDIREPSDAWATIHGLRRLVDIAGRFHLIPMHCLPRAFALQWVLGRRGVRTELRIGVRKEAKGLRAHAWLEHEGRHIGGARPSYGLLAPPAAPLAGR